MPEAHRLVALVQRPYRGEPSRHYAGAPPIHGGEPEVRHWMATPRVLVLESCPDGVFFDRFDDSGDEAGDTWHMSVDEAMAQALAEYGDNLGPWTEVPADEGDPVAFALRLAEAE